MAAVIGARRERVRIVRKTQAVRADGGYDTTTHTVQERWASVEPMSGDESVQAGRLRHAQKYLVTIDAKGADVRVDDYLVWRTGGDIELNVRRVAKSPAHVLALEIEAEAGAIV